MSAPFGADPARVWRALCEEGYALIRLPEALALVERAPWELAERLFGAPIVLVERQPIRPIPGGRSFAASDGPAPLHTDSQRFFGLPAHVQLLVCVAPAERGGESVLVDARAVVAAVRRADPPLFARLTREPRALRFYFGAYHEPTIGGAHGQRFFTHPPRPLAEDEIGARLAPFVAAAPRIELELAAGDALAVNNHWLLHGRHAFSGKRVLLRLLVWLAQSYPRPEGLVSAGERGAEAPFPSADARAWQRVAWVLELVRGVPPGVLAAREGLDEAELYRLRDVVLGAGLEAIK